MRPLLLHWHSRPVTLVKTNLDGDLLLTSGKDSLACLGYVSTGERIGTYSHKGAIFAVDITHDSKYVVTASADGYVNVWHALTGELAAELHHGGIVKFCEWNQNPANQTLVVTCNDQFKGASENNPRRIMVWEFDAEDGELYEKLCISEDDLPQKATKVKWGAGDETLVSIHEEGVVNIWGYPSGELLHSFEASATPITDLQFCGDRMLAITSHRDGLSKLWEMGGCHVFAEAKDLVDTAMFKNKDGKHPGAYDHLARDMLPLAKQSVALTLALKKHNWLETGTWEDNVAPEMLDLVRDVRAGNFPVKKYTTDRPLNTATVSPLAVPQLAADGIPPQKKYHVLMGGGQAASEVTTTKASEGNFSACLYHMVSEEQLGSVSGHFGPMNTMAFMHDGAGFITGGEDGYVRIHHFDPDYLGSKRWD